MKYHLENLYGKENKLSRLTLKHRLSDLLLANFEIHFPNTANKGYPYALAESIALTRNYYVHFDLSKQSECLSEYDLMYMVPILRFVLLYYIAKYIGISDEKIEILSKDFRTMIVGRYDFDNI